MIFAMHDPLADLLGEWSRGLNTGSVLLRIALAVLLASVIGCERSSKRHSAGLRTFVLVSFASTVSMLLDVYLMSNFGARLPILSAATVIAAALACVIVVVACNYIFKHKKTGTILEYALLFPWLLPTILICYSYRTFFNSSDVWYVFGQNLYYADRVRILIVIAYTVVKLPFSLRMIKASFYAIDEELEDAARNLGSGPVRTFLKVKLPIILPSVLAVFALNFNALFTEYDMSATFASTYGTTYAMVIQSMCREEGLYGYNVNASGRRCASTVFIMLVSGLILYLVYGVGARDLGERLEARDRRRKRMDRIKAVFHKKRPAEAASPQ